MSYHGASRLFRTAGGNDEALKSKHEGRKGGEPPRGKKTGEYGWVVGGTAAS